MKIGVALSTGGAKVISAIGVIEELTNNNIEIDSISGASMGAIVAAAYAIKGDIKLIKEIITNLSQFEVNMMFAKDFNWFKLRGGLFKGQVFEDFLGKILGHHTLIEDCVVPLTITGTDYWSMEEAVFTKGNLLTAVRASIAMSFAFEPINIDNRDIFDGGYSNPLPIDHCREMGSRKVIAVTGFPLSADKVYIENVKRERSKRIGSPDKSLRRSIDALTSALIKEKAKDADVCIEPKVEQIDVLDLWKGTDAINAGRVACKKKMKEIKRLKWRLW